MKWILFKIKNKIHKILNVDTNDNSITAKFKENSVLNIFQIQHDKFRDTIYYITNIIKEIVCNKYFSKSNYFIINKKI